MSLILLDSGNSRLKWAAMPQAGPYLRSNAVVRPSDQRWGEVLDMAMVGFEKPDRVIVADVAGASTRSALAGWFRSNWALVCEFVEELPQWPPFATRYRDPPSLGVDRWLALLGACQVVKPPILLVDCGTAVTLDVLDEGPCHLGGLILPGPGFMLQSLQTAVDSLAVPPEFVSETLGCSTGEGLGIGVGRALADLVQATLTRLQRDSSLQPSLVVCGGDREVLCRYLEVPAEEHDDLVLHGMAVLVQRG